jgi:hypothetical protein
LLENVRCYDGEALKIILDSSRKTEVYTVVEEIAPALDHQVLDAQPWASDHGEFDDLASVLEVIKFTPTDQRVRAYQSDQVVSEIRQGRKFPQTLEGAGSQPPTTPCETTNMRFAFIPLA